MMHIVHCIQHVIKGRRKGEGQKKENKSRRFVSKTPHTLHERTSKLIVIRGRPLQTKQTKQNKQLTRNASEVSETLNHTSSTGDHGGNKIGNVQQNSEGNHDPVLDRVAPPDVTLPE